MQTSSPIARQAFAAFFGTLMFVADLGPAAAQARLESEGGIADLEELSHDVSIHIDGLLAHVTTTQRIANQSSAARVGIYQFDLPSAAAITSFAVTPAGGRRARSIAVDAVAAITPVPETETLDVAEDPGLLRLIEIVPGEDIRRYELRIWPIAAGRHITIERSWVLPAQYQDGRVRLRLPDRGTSPSLVRRQVSVSIRAPRGATGHAKVFGGGKQLATKTGATTAKLRFEEPVGADITVEATPTYKDGTSPQVEYTSVATADGETVTALSVVVPHTRGESIAMFENVVVAVDVSRSLGKAGLAAAAELTDAILATSDPAARVEVVVFDRAARRVLGKLMHNSRDARKLANSTLTEAKLQNGSDLGKAIDEVRAVVEATPAYGSNDVIVERGVRSPTLVVVISDGMLPVSLTPDEALTRFGGVALSESEILAITLVPDDGAIPDEREGPLSELIRQSRGRAVAVRHSDASRRGAQVLTELTRASALDGAVVAIDGDDDAGPPLPQRMEPGEGVVVFGAHDGKLPKAVVLRASVNGENLDVRAKRGSKEFAKAMRAVVLSQVQLDPDVGAKERRAVLRLIEQSPVVGRHSSLIALDDRDAFARERLARIKKWGSGQFRRVVSQEEDLVTEEPLGLATMAEPAGKGSAHIASYRSTGELDQKIIKRLITAHVLPQARACYEKEIRRDRSLRGDMTLEVEMARGEVQFAKVGSSTLASGNIERCVIDAAYSIPVPAVAQGDALEVTYLARYPLRFRIKDQKGRVGLADSPTPPERIDPSGSTDPLDGLPTD